MGLLFHKKIEYKSYLTPEEVKEKLANTTIAYKGKIKAEDIEKIKNNRYIGFFTRKNKFEMSLNEGALQRSTTYFPTKRLRSDDEIFVPFRGVQIKIQTRQIQLYKVNIKGKVFEEDYGSNINIRIVLPFLRVLEILETNSVYILIPCLFISVIVGAVVPCFDNSGTCILFNLFIVTPLIISFLNIIAIFEIRWNFQKDVKEISIDLAKIFEAKYTEEKS